MPAVESRAVAGGGLGEDGQRHGGAFEVRAVAGKEDFRGFERLDRAALDTVMRWRYVPGKRGDVPEAMWFNVPLNFVLE